MDTITSRHGLVSLNRVKDDDEVELSSLPLELQLELKSLKDQFTVGPITLKKITKRFEQELQDGWFMHLQSRIRTNFIRTRQLWAKYCALDVDSVYPSSLLANKSCRV